MPTTAFDRQITDALDQVGFVGPELRERLLHELKSKVVMRGARDTLRVLGDAGSGRHMVVDAAHDLAERVLGRQGARINVDCGDIGAGVRIEAALRGPLADARGGSLVMERFGSLDAPSRRAAERLVSREGEGTFLVTLGEDEAEVRTGATIRIKPLHERETDIWALVDHFAQAAFEDAGVTGTRGFSRQAKADVAGAVKETGLASVRRLRDLVRDVVFDTVAAGELPLKITSELVRPLLEVRFQQSDADRAAREEALLDSQFEHMDQASLLARLAEVHGVPVEVLQQQADIVRRIVQTIDDVPSSYRNIMDRTEDILRASIWLVSKAETQAEFRRYFGDQRFMRPTKSVAWAFYNRVFKRDM